MPLPTMNVGQSATAAMTFSGGVPTDGVVASDNLTVATVSLAADGITWTVAVVGPGTANMTYTGTSVAPLVGPCVVPPVVITGQAAAVAETGSFNEGSAVIT
jgi:hypothetical protein